MQRPIGVHEEEREEEEEEEASRHDRDAAPWYRLVAWKASTNAD